MTQLELFEDYPRRGLTRFVVVRWFQWTIATLQARAALSRIVKAQQTYRLEDIPSYLRRDLGLPEVDEAPWRHTAILLATLRLK